MSVREILSKISDEHHRNNRKVSDLVKWGIPPQHKRIIAEAALEGLRKSGYTVILTDKSPVQNFETAILNENCKKKTSTRRSIVFKGPSRQTRNSATSSWKTTNITISFRSYALQFSGSSG